MFIYPYYTIDLGATKLYWLFLMKGGTTPWETDEKGIKTNKFLIDTYLKPNGFVGRCTCVKGDSMYYEVDVAAMQMGDFYTWTDFLGCGKGVPGDVDVWRPFVWMDEPGWASVSPPIMKKFMDGLSPLALRPLA
jgi:hypothetical protein